MEFVRMDEIEDVHDLKMDHMNTICEPWELYTEIMAKPSAPYLIRSDDGEEMGFFLLDGEGTMFQFHLLSRFVPEVDDVFSKIMKDHEVKKAVCQTFDHLFLQVCLKNMKTSKVIGYNFRERIEPREAIPQFDVTERKATLDDVDMFRKYSDGIFEEHELKDIPYWLERSETTIFEDDNGEFAGYGMINRTLPDRDWYDVGMYVRPELRKKGYGAFIIDRLAYKVQMKGGIPCAGCDVNNIGSKRTLERAGFISRHLILEFEF